MMETRGATKVPAHAALKRSAPRRKPRFLVFHVVFASSPILLSMSTFWASASGLGGLILRSGVTGAEAAAAAASPCGLESRSAMRAQLCVYVCWRERELKLSRCFAWFSGWSISQAAGGGCDCAGPGGFPTFGLRRVMSIDGFGLEEVTYRRG